MKLHAAHCRNLSQQTSACSTFMDAAPGTLCASKNACALQDRKLAREGLWAHETELPEVGGLLLARAEAPDLNSDSRLCQLVIFLLEHGPDGSKGVIINRPARANVGDLLEWGYQPSQVSDACKAVLAKQCSILCGSSSNSIAVSPFTLAC